MSDCNGEGCQDCTCGSKDIDAEMVKKIMSKINEVGMDSTIKSVVGAVGVSIRSKVEQGDIGVAIHMMALLLKSCMVEAGKELEKVGDAKEAFTAPSSKRMN